MPNAIAAGGDLHERAAAFDPVLLDPQARASALDRFLTEGSGRQRPGRYWRIDLEALAPAAQRVRATAGSVTIRNDFQRIVACDLATAARDHRALLSRAFGTTAAGRTKFGALATAFAGLGAFVYLPAGVDAAEPIVIEYALEPDGAAFPYTVVLAEAGARATVVERISGGDTFACGVDEIVAEAGADVRFASIQLLSAGSTFVQTRVARAARDARVAWACADLGAALALDEIEVAIAGPGVDAGVTALFFPNGSQHVDVVSTVDHAAGDSTSETVVKSAAVDAGQARFLGNIRIAPKSQGSDASLRDDALLLSKRAHIDSVPALEIAANDVKAYHGATVGAIDADQLFYMETRGLERDAAERMIALGFFEPAIARFPGSALREEIRSALEGKLQ